VMWLRACLNGPRPTGSHPAVPIMPSELAREGRRAIDAGAIALHMHPRALNGKETLEPEQMAAALIADDAQRLIAAGLAPRCNHVQIEPILTQNITEALSTAQAIARVLDEAGVTTPRLLQRLQAGMTATSTACTAH